MKYVDLKEVLFPDGIVPVSGGGTGATNAVNAWSNLKQKPKNLFHGTCSPGATINVPGYKKYSVFLFRPDSTATIGVMSNPGDDYSATCYITGTTSNVWTGNGNTDGGTWRVSFTANPNNEQLTLNGCPYRNDRAWGANTWNSHGVTDIWGVI